MACYSLGHDADLLEEREIVFHMPVVGDPAVADTQDVGGDEIDWSFASRMCHTRVQPDGTIIKGAQGNFSGDRVAAFTLR